MKPPTVLVIGEALMDVVVSTDGSKTERPGGSPANVAITLGRLGQPVELLTKIGSDERGDAITTWLHASNVVLHPGSHGAGATSTAIATLDQAGAATYELQLDWDLPPLETVSAAIVHIGSISATLPPGAAHVRETVATSRTDTLISYDPNIRPAHIDDPDRTRDAVFDLVALADVVKLSDEDLRWLFSTADLDDHAATLAAAGPIVVIVTRGHEGLTLHRGAERIDVPAPAVDVADTVGAGDTVMGTFLAWLIDSAIVGSSIPAAESRHRLAAASRQSLLEALRLSAAAAAVTVSRPGADPPWPDEIAAKPVTHTHTPAPQQSNPERTPDHGSETATRA